MADEQLYFEDVPLDRTFVTTGRTITEADLLGFASLSGDFNALHMDAALRGHHALRQPDRARPARAVDRLGHDDPVVDHARPEQVAAGD